jgi:rfaE bifunctional protein nucleotidyltransferase chain/domain
MRRSRKKTLTSKIKSPLGLKRSLSRLKKRTVFTNGCFDLLHKGHVHYLEKAQKLGDLLIVALNSDASVKRLKGQTRPINPLEDRLEVMAALESVDFVTWFEEDTPLELIRLIQPQVLVKGGDWKPDQIVGSEDVLANGGKVLSLQYIEGKSTTQMIARAQNGIKNPV